MTRRASRPLCILSIEDDPNDQELLRRAFRKAGQGDVLRVVSSVAEAREALDVRPSPCAALLDLKLRGESGFDFLGWLRSRSDARLRRLPVLVLTSSAEEEDMSRSYALGANGFFVKPGDFGELMELAKTIVEHWGLFNRVPAA
jgi:DNA-binding response OmpR family regulator